MDNSGLMGAFIGFVGVIVVFLFMAYLFFQSPEYTDFSTRSTEKLGILQSSVVPLETMIKAPAVDTGRVLLPVYPTNDYAFPVLTTMVLNDEIEVLERLDEWSKIASSKGVPVWIKAELLQESASGYVDVIANKANGRSVPNKDNSVVLGVVLQGERLKVNKKIDGWVRVWSPNRIHAWVKTVDLRLG